MIVKPASRIFSAISFGVFLSRGRLDKMDHAVQKRFPGLEVMLS